MKFYPYVCKNAPCARDADDQAKNIVYWFDPVNKRLSFFCHDYWEPSVVHRKEPVELLDDLKVLYANLQKIAVIVGESS